MQGNSENPSSAAIIASPLRHRNDGAEEKQYNRNVFSHQLFRKDVILEADGVEFVAFIIGVRVYYKRISALVETES